jgi:hypothetical protein
MHSEQAVQSILKSSIDPPPGGHTGNVLFSFTDEAFFGTGGFLSCPLAINGRPKNNAIDPSMNFRFLTSVLMTFFSFVTIPKEIALSWQIFIQLKQPTHLLTSTWC